MQCENNKILPKSSRGSYSLGNGKKKKWKRSRPNIALWLRSGLQLSTDAGNAGSEGTVF